VRPPNSQNPQSEREPLVLESCRACIESAALFIRFLDVAPAANRSAAHHTPRFQFGWYNGQILFAAFLVLLQVKSIPMLVPILRSIGDVERLIERVGQMFESDAQTSPMTNRYLEILRYEIQS